MTEPVAVTKGRDPRFIALLESAAHLQKLIPGAVLVGGTAAILYADHRESTDHDHVLADLADRFEMVLEAVEEDEGWATNRITPGKVILASQLARQLADPRPADKSVTKQLASYRRLRKRWTEWSAVTKVLGEVAAAMVSR